MTPIASAALLAVGLGFTAAGNSLYYIRREDIALTSSKLLRAVLGIGSLIGFLMFISSAIASFFNMEWYLALLALFGSLVIWGRIYPPIARKAFDRVSIESSVPDAGLRTFVRIPTYAAMCYAIGLPSLGIWHYVEWAGRA